MHHFPALIWERSQLPPKSVANASRVKVYKACIIHKRKTLWWLCTFMTTLLETDMAGNPEMTLVLTVLWMSLCFFLLNVCKSEGTAKLAHIKLS